MELLTQTNAMTGNNKNFDKKDGLSDDDNLDAPVFIPSGSTVENDLRGTYVLTDVLHGRFVIGGISFRG